MPLVVAPTIQTVLAKLRTLVLAVVPAGVEVVQGMDNRVSPPPRDPGYVRMTPILQQRLRTNVDAYDDPAQPPGPPFTVGTRAMEQGTKITVQLDCYGPTGEDWAVMLSTVLRSEYACDVLAPDVAPLYADEPKVSPYVDGERQYEPCWIVGAVLQYNPVTSTPQEFADTLDVNPIINVDVEYPPT